MRAFVFVSSAVGLLILFAPGCGSSTSTSSEGGVADASSEDGTTNDAAADTGDGCVLMGGTYDKTCTTAADCLMVSRGCFCGAQPIIGVAKSAQPAAQTCEHEAEKKCALGCANAPGHVGEDGQNDEGTGRNLEVRCDDNKCHTVLGS